MNRLPPPPYTKFSLPSCERLIKGSEYYTGVRIPTTPILQPLTCGPTGYPSAPLPNNHHCGLLPIYTRAPTNAVDVLCFWGNDHTPDCPGVALIEIYTGKICIAAPDHPCALPPTYRPSKIQLLIEFPGYESRTAHIEVGPPEQRISRHDLAFVISREINEYFKDGEFDPEQTRRYHPGCIVHNILNLRLVSIYSMPNGIWAVQCCYMIPRH